jgi:hypothetical protein
MPWSGRLLLLVAGAAMGAILVVTARRDLARRDPAAVRGDPDVWRRVTYLPGPAAAYLIAGRRRTSPPHAA